MPVGVNIEEARATPLDQAVEDYLACFHILADQADYFTVNLSSPNTQGLRELQSAEYLRDLLQCLRDANKRHAKKLGRQPHPMLLKIAPDLTYPEIDVIIEVLLDLGFDGIIATNTTIARPTGLTSNETGGLSGGDFLFANVQVKSLIISIVSTLGRLPIIGVGGIDSPESAEEKMDAGAAQWYNSIQVGFTADHFLLKY